MRTAKKWSDVDAHLEQVEKDKKHLEWWAAEKAAYAAKRIALGHTDHEKAATEQHDDDEDSIWKDKRESLASVASVPGGGTT